MTDKELTEIARNAELLGKNDLAIVLYTYLGSKHVGVSSDFARHCQAFAREGLKKVKMHRHRRNN